MKCSEMVTKYEGLARYRLQCKREAVKDGLCTIHSPEYIAKKNAERDAKYEQRSAARSAEWKLNTAAPQLLEALQEIVAAMAHRREEWPEVIKARAAIAKALGK